MQWYILIAKLLSYYSINTHVGYLFQTMRVLTLIKSTFQKKKKKKFQGNALNMQKCTKENKKLCWYKP